MTFLWLQKEDTQLSAVDSTSWSPRIIFSIEAKIRLHSSHVASIFYAGSGEETHSMFNYNQYRPNSQLHVFVKRWFVALTWVVGKPYEPSQGKVSSSVDRGMLARRASRRQLNLLPRQVLSEVPYMRIEDPRRSSLHMRTIRDGIRGNVVAHAIASL
jgi:hypothetical protein